LNEPSVISSPWSEILRLLVPLAALAAMASFAGREVDPSGAAESAYLALLAAAVLLPVGFLAPWPALELGVGSALATAAVWALPPGPGNLSPSATRALAPWTATDPDAVRVGAAGAPGGTISADHVGAVEALVTSWRGQGEVSLPGGVKVSRKSGRLSLLPPSLESSEAPWI